MWPGHMDHMSWMWGWWIVALAAVLVVIWAIARASNAQASRPADDSPETILKRRYARGELNDDEFERQLRALRK